MAKEKLERHRYREILDEVFRDRPMTEEERAWADSVLDAGALIPSRRPRRP